jgi:endonuclease/exonuclease/phosphatase (EEP) superfamily protein YafD
MPFLRVVTWNIAEGLWLCPESATDNSCQIRALDAIAGALASLQPDLVLLNEIMIWNWHTWGGVDQVTRISNAIGLPHVQSATTATLFLEGEKKVVVMSRFPLTFERRIEHSWRWDGAGYATLHVSFVSDGIRHHVFSTRFSHHDPVENNRSHDELASAIRALPLNESVIAGGDFNADRQREGFVRFTRFSGLQNVFAGSGSEPEAIDHLFYRGPYRVLRAEHADPLQPKPTDHPWVFADLLPLNWQQPRRDGQGLAAAVPTPNELLVVRSTPVQSRTWKPQGGWGRSWVAHSSWAIHGSGPIAAIAEGGRSHLLCIRSDGGVAALERVSNGSRIWVDVVGTNLSKAELAVPGGAVSGDSSESGLLHVLYASASGATLAVIGNTNFSSWRTREWVRRGLTAPGGHVTGVSRRRGFVDIFTVGTDRRVYTAAWTSQHGWAGWWRIPGISAPPGAPIAAVSRRQDFLDIFVADDAGRTMSAAWSPAENWKGWWHIQNGITAPGGCISAVSRRPDYLDIFTLGSDTRMYTAAWNPSHGWGGWWGLNARGQFAGEPVASVSRSANLLDIFVIDSGGVVQTMGWAPGGNWGGPWSLPG